MKIIFCRKQGREVMIKRETKDKVIQQVPSPAAHLLQVRNISNCLQEDPVPRIPENINKIIHAAAVCQHIPLCRGQPTGIKGPHQGNRKKHPVIHSGPAHQSLSSKRMSATPMPHRSFKCRRTTANLASYSTRPSRRMTPLSLSRFSSERRRAGVPVIFPRNFFLTSFNIPFPSISRSSAATIISSLPVRTPSSIIRVIKRLY